MVLPNLQNGVIKHLQDITTKKIFYNKKTMTKKIIRLTESELIQLIKTAIKEDTTGNCASPDSPEGQQMLQSFATEINNSTTEMGITQEDLDASQGEPEQEYKDELNKMSAGVTLDEKGLKSLIKSLKQVIKGKYKVEEQTQDEFINKIIGYITGLPKPVLIIVAVWYLLRCLRCLIYKIERRIVGGCGLQFKRTPLAIITQLLLLDFRNLRTYDEPYMYCFGQNPRNTTIY